MRNRRPNHAGGVYTPAAYGAAPSAVNDPYLALFGRQAADAGSTVAGAHPLYDARHNSRLLARENEIKAAFGAIESTVREIAALPADDEFAKRAQALVAGRLGFQFPGEWLVGNWSQPVDMRRLYAYAAFRAFRSLADRNFDRSMADQAEGEPAAEVIRKWGFHAIDITPCADGRLSGVVDYILRVPPAVVANRKSFAGSMFDIEESVRNWMEIDLRRHREGLPNPAAEPTRYLKIGVYHTSSSDPGHEGCAAHGSDERKAAGALLERLNSFARAIENSHCCGASVATLLVGVDTDTDAIRVHVPDANGTLSLDRYVDNIRLYEATGELARDAAKQAIRQAVNEAAGVAEDDTATEGMRWFVAYLLKNNMAQIEYVRSFHGGRYADLGHTERFISVGDSFDDVQMRNFAYQAQMETVEEGAADMDVGIKIFKKVNVKHGLPIPVFVHVRFNGRVPGSRERAVERGRRLERAIRARYADLVRERWLYTFATVKDIEPGSRLEEVDSAEMNLNNTCACQCDQVETRQ